jgi:TolB-like protein
MADMNPAHRLDSWKEIASFLRRDVRTVQRWEKKEALPVHRHQHDKLGSVYAYPEELNEWFTNRQHSGITAETRQSDKIKLAVLPFGVLGEEHQDNYFTDGLTEEMITQVARLQPEQLAVIAHNSVLQYDSSSKSLQQMRHDLGVDYTLQGKVRRAGNRVRITAQLSEIQDQTQLWAETYERDISDVLGVQAETAQAIAVEIHVALNLSESTRLADLQKGKQRVNAEAYDAYLRGRYHLHEMMPASIEKSVTEFARAVELDATYASAYSGLAIASALLAIVPFDVAPPHDTMPRAEEAARKALALEQDDAIAQLKAASGAPGDFPLADAALGLAYAVAGLLDEAQKIGARFRDIIARRYIPPTYFGMLYAGIGDRDRAMVWLNKACAERADGLTWLAVEPMMDDIRSDERFQELLEKLGLDKITQLPAEPQPS